MPRLESREIAWIRSLDGRFVEGGRRCLSQANRPGGMLTAVLKQVIQVAFRTSRLDRSGDTRATRRLQRKSPR